MLTRAIVVAVANFQELIDADQNLYTPCHLSGIEPPNHTCLLGLHKHVGPDQPLTQPTNYFLCITDSEKQGRLHV